MIRNPAAPILVVGATGATGRHVVQQLLDQGRFVKAMVRSKARMLSLLTTLSSAPPTTPTSTPNIHSSLALTEASILDLSESELLEQVKDVEAVVVCLGHTLSWQGVFGEPRRLVRDSVQKLSSALSTAQTQAAQQAELPTTSTTPVIKKLIIMGSDGVPHPAGTDDRRSYIERIILQIMLWTLPPHIDNQETADYVYHSLGRDSVSGWLEWIVVRPTDLIDDPTTTTTSTDADGVSQPLPPPPYTFFDKPQGSLFGSGVATRSNVARAMVDLLTDPALWNQYKFSMPTIYDQPAKKIVAPDEDKKKTS